MVNRRENSDLFTAVGGIETTTLSSVKAPNVDDYDCDFNAEGIDSLGVSAPSTFGIGAGVRPPNAGANVSPKVVGSGNRDFGGFVVWRNGWVSVFRSPDQMDSSIASITAGTSF